MTIDVVTKAGSQIGISILPEELSASEEMRRMIQLILLGASTAEAEHEEASPKAKAPAPKPKKPATNPRAAEIDKGKIVALWTAGWKIRKIAEECNCSDQTVYNTLKEKGLRPVVPEATAE